MAKTATQPKTWEDRIVRRDHVDPAQLLASPKNFRRHTREQKQAFRGLVAEVGYIDPVLCQLDGTVIDGHLRVEVALEDGIATIPVDFYDGTPEQADLILATKDPLAAMAYHDQEQLDALLAEISTDDAGVQALLDSLTAPDFDPNEHWQGMPEFQQDDQMPVKQVIVNFGSESDLKAFARLVEQNVQMTTKSVWYPAKPHQNVRDIGYLEGRDDVA